VWVAFELIGHKQLGRLWCKNSSMGGSTQPIFVTFGRFVTFAVALLPLTAGAAVTYDIVYVRQPRFGDHANTTWPEVAHPAKLDPGADLMLLHPNGTEELLVAGGAGSVTDPFVSFDAQWVYYSYFYDLRPESINTQRDLSYAGADIFRINLATRAIQQLTFGEFTPNTGSGNWDESNPLNPGAGYDYLGYGIVNVGPAPVAGGKIAFTSNRNGFVPPKGLTNPTLQLFVMDEDGSNVTQIAPMNIGSVLHPTPLRDGRLMFSSMETQGLRDDRMWGIWSIYPDGRHWAPVVSAFHEGQAFHFMTQLSNDDLVVVDYYNLNDNGFGALFRLPVRPPAGTPGFHSAFPADNPPIQQTVGGGFSYPFTMPFTPWGLYSIVPFTHGNDEAAPVGSNGVRVGKFTHPTAAPNNDVLVAWTPGPANSLDRPSPEPYYNSGLYLVPRGDIVNSPGDLVLIKNDPNYNEAWPRPVVTYRAVHGVDAPDQLPWLPNDGTLHSELPAGTPYGLVGTSSFYKRESFPGVVPPWSDTFDGLDAFNTSENGQSSNWDYQGADAGKYTNSDIWAVRLLAMEPNTHRSYGPNGGPSGGQLFFSHAMERLRILGEIPLRKSNSDGSPVLDPEGNPDTSFLVKVPADTPFTFQMIDRNAMVLAMAQTWHQLRPGEVRYDCGGCHAHSQQPLDFDSTYAARPEYQVRDLSKTTPLLTRDAGGAPALRTVNSSVVSVEFLRDVRPILQRSCVPCHTKNAANPPGALVLDDYTPSGVGVPGDYARLADDEEARWGYPPLVRVGTPVWRQSNASRYVRKFQSRRSLLAWKIFGQRLDGWSNADHPTESVPGDATTLPSGATTNEADLDFTGTIMPPSGSNVPPLTIDEKMLIARWIDLGAPINYAGSGFGWFLDEVRPALTVSVPRPGANPSPLTEIRIGAADADSGINVVSLSVTADIAIDGHAAGEELASLAVSAGDGIYSIRLSTPIDAVTGASLLVTVSDNQGNITRVARKFSVGSGGPAPSPTTPRPTATRVPTATPTPTVSGIHDSVVLARHPVRIRLRNGVESKSKMIRVSVKNADGLGDSHEIQLVTGPGSCPPATVADQPDFFRRQLGAQDRIVLKGGRRKAAWIPLFIHRDAFTSPTATTPATCMLRFTAVGPGTDPTPENNVVDVELDVFDANDF
jgi:hydrazine synthase alpha subunit-like protein